MPLSCQASVLAERAAPWRCVLVIFLVLGVRSVWPGSAPTAADSPPPQWSAVAIPPGQIDRAVAAIDRLAGDLLKRSGVPGMAVAIVRGDALVYVRGFGVRQAGQSAPVDADTVFQLASLSKPLGATVVAAAVGRGWIAWDTPIVAQLPWFRLADSYVTRNVTVGDLYAHRSGLPDHAGDSLEDLGYGRTAVIERLRLLPLTPFRSSYAYTNFGLTTAAEAVAASRGVTWARLSDELIYRPLGMSATSSDFAAYAGRRNKAVGHVRRDDGRWVPGAVRQPDAQSPAGGASSSVRDLARWMRMVLALGSYEGREVVARAALLEALAPRIRSDPLSPPVNRASFYGYGIGISHDGAGRARLSHSGAFALGSGTSFTLLPSENLGIVTLTNGMPIGVPEALNAAFLDLVETGSVQRDWLDAFWARGFQPLYRNPGSLAGRDRPDSPAPARLLQAYAGRYVNNYYGEVGIAVEGGQLVMDIGPQPLRFGLRHWSGDQFSYEPVGENAVGTAAVWFRTDASGRIHTLEIENFEPGVRVLTRQP
ncbi:MAG: serine hydrolase [Gammaproteobacteria bacterium]|nr:serine hydrolase [Gammaproteobacteria bacterium]